KGTGILKPLIQGCPDMTSGSMVILLRVIYLLFLHPEYNNGFYFSVYQKANPIFSKCPLTFVSSSSTFVLNFGTGN
ncbi:MAG: hypothetical protein PHU34_01050, partial [Candidatus Methanoperedens sp.]|nr:hypothetical protein [Candidatus Methanoperedens sp.]